MSASVVRPSDWLWKEGAGYYTEMPEDLALRPVLPDVSRLRDRRLFGLFDTFGGLAPGSRVLEIGCGRSPWLPFLANRLGCRVTGIDIEPYAADLARGNLTGAGAIGEIVCADAFGPAARADLRGAFDLVYSMGVLEHYADVVERIAAVADYLKPGGRILTTVPNLQGLNWLMQRLFDLKTLQTHVIYDKKSLVRVHEAAGFRTIAAGYTGFFDGHLASAAGATGRLRRTLHRRLCRTLSLGAEAWVRLGGERSTPDLRLTAPHVFCVARREAGVEEETS